MKNLVFLFDKFVDKKIELEVKKVYITAICILEDMARDGIISEESFQQKRKAILNVGNSAVRNLQEQISLIFENVEVLHDNKGD
jgi:hypothetical protein